MGTPTRAKSEAPRPSIVSTVTNNVPDAATPQSNCRRNGSGRALPAGNPMPGIGMGDLPGIEIGDIPGIGIGGEVGSGTGISMVPVVDVGIDAGTVRAPKRSRNSNPNPRTVTAR